MRDCDAIPYFTSYMDIFLVPCAKYHMIPKFGRLKLFFLCSWILWGIWLGQNRDDFTMSGTSVRKTWEWNLGGWGEVYLEVWCLRWEDLRIRAADCCTCPGDLACSQHRVIGFLILHLRMPNTCIPVNKVEADLPFTTQPCVSVISAECY